MATRRLFTEEEMEALRSNPYTYKVTMQQLHFTAEFKQLFWDEYQKSKTPKEILTECGYDIFMLGDNRIQGIQEHICKAGRNGEVFHTGNMPREHMNPGSPEDELRQLKGEVEYLREEVEFLKKISSARISGKRGKS